MAVLSPTFPDGGDRLRDAKLLVRGHTAREWQQEGSNTGPADSSQTWRLPACGVIRVRLRKETAFLSPKQQAKGDGSQTGRGLDLCSPGPPCGLSSVPQLPLATPSCSRNAGCKGGLGTSWRPPSLASFPAHPPLLPGSPQSEQFQDPQIPGPASKLEEAENFPTVLRVEGRLL